MTSPWRAQNRVGALHPRPWGPGQLITITSLALYLVLATYRIYIFGIFFIFIKTKGIPTPSVSGQCWSMVTIENWSLTAWKASTMTAASRCGYTFELVFYNLSRSMIRCTNYSYSEINSMRSLFGDICFSHSHFVKCGDAFPKSCTKLVICKQ